MILGGHPFLVDDSPTRDHSDINSGIYQEFGQISLERLMGWARVDIPDAMAPEQSYLQRYCK